MNNLWVFTDIHRNAHNLSQTIQQQIIELWHQLTETVWDSLRLGERQWDLQCLRRSSIGFWVGRGFDSLHPLHFSTLHSERFTDAIEQWGFCFSQRLQWASSEIWRSNSVLWSLCFCINWWICCCCRCLRRFISLDCFVLSNLRLSLMSMLLLRSRST